MAAATSVQTQLAIGASNTKFSQKNKNIKRRPFSSKAFILVVQMFEESGLSWCAPASETSLQVWAAQAWPLKSEISLSLSFSYFQFLISCTFASVAFEKWNWHSYYSLTDVRTKKEASVSIFFNLNFKPFEVWAAQTQPLKSERNFYFLIWETNLSQLSFNFLFLFEEW